MLLFFQGLVFEEGSLLFTRIYDIQKSQSKSTRSIKFKDCPFSKVRKEVFQKLELNNFEITIIFDNCLFNNTNDDILLNFQADKVFFNNSVLHSFNKGKKFIETTTYFNFHICFQSMHLPYPRYKRPLLNSSRTFQIDINLVCFSELCSIIYRKKGQSLVKRTMVHWLEK